MYIKMAKHSKLQSIKRVRKLLKKTELFSKCFARYSNLFMLE